MAARTYGGSNLPVVVRTIVTTTKDTIVTQVETVHDDGAVPAATVDPGTYGITECYNEPLGGGFVKQRVTYTAANYTTSAPATTYSSQGSQIDVPIEQHPSYNPSWADSKKGVEAYSTGSTTVTKTQYFLSRPSDPYTSIGTLATPGGPYGSAGHWLIVGTAVSKISEGLYALATQYLYSSKPWDTDIYS